MALDTIETSAEICRLEARLAAAERAEQRLRESEARLKAVLDAADLGAWHWNIRTGQVEMNPRYVEMFGFSLDEIEQRQETFFSRLHPDDVQRVKQALDKHFRGKADNYSVEVRLRHKQGHWVWVLTTGRVIERDDEGRPLIMTGTHQEISERVAERQALEESETRFRWTFENAAVGMAHVGIDGRWLRVNRRLCEITGYGRGELLAKTFQDITHPDDLSKDVEGLNRLLRNEISGYQRQKRYLTKAGGIVWVHLTASLQRDPEGKPLYGIAVVEDISEQKRTEEALRRSEERLAAAVRGGKLGVFDYYPHTGQVEWDQTVRTLWGVSSNELVTYETFAAGVHPEDLPTVKKLMKAALDPDDDHSFAAEYRVINRRTGEVRWVRAEGDFTLIDGTAVRLVGVVSDITERRQAEEHRKLLVNELNHRVKNTLAIVQGVALQTFRRQGAVCGEAFRAFQDRLAVLAAAHDLLTCSNWGATTLDNLARATIKAAGAPGASVRITGPAVNLHPKQVVTFAMALHELCTNAIKYGALSIETGHVDLTWTVVDGGNGRRMRLIWHELGGPPVQPPQKRGFGSRLIEGAMAAELGGDVHMDFRPEGLVCTIEGQLDDPGGTA